MAQPTRFVGACLIASLAQAAWGANGRIEINQTCALAAAGCFAGDAQGFPVEIGQAGSYVLTSSLVVPAGASGIVVTTPGVTLDLNGFRVAGPLVCSGQGSTLDCGPTPPVGVGIQAGDVGFAPAAVIENGQVSGFGDGVVADGGIIRGIVARGNYSDGFSVSGATVAGCQGTENGRRGIYGTSASLLGNVASYNKESGLDTTSGGSVVAENTAFGNGAFGIIASRSQIQHNAVRENGADGINAGIGSLVADNVAHDNSGDGIQASEGSSVQRNTAYGNQGYGLELSISPGVGYRENAVTANVGGTVHGGVDVGDNLCNGTKTCP